MPVQIDGRGGYDSFALTSRPTGVMLLTRRQPFYPSAAHDKFFSICTAFSGYTEFGIAPQPDHRQDHAHRQGMAAASAGGHLHCGISECRPLSCAQRRIDRDTLPLESIWMVGKWFWGYIMGFFKVTISNQRQVLTAWIANLNNSPGMVHSHIII